MKDQKDEADQGEAVDEERRKLVRKLAYAPPMLVSLTVSTSVSAQVTSPPPPPGGAPTNQPLRRG